MRGHHEGTIFYSKTEGRWVAAISLPNGRRRRRMATSPAGARKALAALQREAEAGVDAGRLTTGAYLRSWLHDAPARGPRTMAKRSSIVLVHLDPALGRIPLRQLRPADVQHFLNDLALAPVTVGHIRSVLRTALSDAVRQGLLERNVAQVVSAPPRQRQERRWLAAGDARRLLDGTVGDRLHALYVLSVTTGLRQGECLALGWDDVDLEAGTIRVNATPRPPRCTWHDLRHSAASVMLTAGVPLRVIADILGHSTIRVTADLYAHVGPELQREAAEKMEEALR